MRNNVNLIFEDLDIDPKEVFLVVNEDVLFNRPMDAINILKDSGSFCVRGESTEDGIFRIYVKRDPRLLLG